MRARLATIAAALALVLLLAAAAPPVRAADAARAEGTVSFVASASIYASLGREDGVEVGAELRVIRDGRTIARLRVEAVSSGSAVAVAMAVEAEVRPGDTVVLVAARRSVAAPPAAPAAAPQRAPAPAPPPSAPARPPRAAALAPADVEALWVKVEAAPAPKVPYRRRAGEPPPAPPARRSGAPAGQVGSAAPGAPEANRVRGSVTLGWFASFDDSPDSPDYSRHAPRASATIDVDRIGGEPLRFRFRGDARAIFQDENRFDRRGAEFVRRASLSELSLTWSPVSAPLRVAVGRVFASDAPQTRSVDGARVAALLGPLEVGAFAGLDAAPDLDDRGRTKVGGYLTLRGHVAEATTYEGSLAFARIGTSDGDLDRQIVALWQRIAFSSVLSAYNLAEVDLYSGTENPLDRRSADLTALALGVRARPARFLDLGVSYDRRRPFYGEIEIDDLEPALVEDLEDDVRQTFRADARVWLPATAYVSAWADRRLGAGDEFAAGGEIGFRDLAASGVSAALGGSYTRTRYVRGPSIFVRGTSVILDVLEASLSWRTTIDEYEDGDRARAVRHEPRAGVVYLISNALSAEAEVGYEFGDEVRRATVAVSVTYRF